MHEAAQGALVLRLHRNHVPVRTHGDNGILKHLGISRRGDDLVQHVPDLRAGRPHMPPDTGQFGAGRIGDLLLPHDGEGDLLLQKLVGDQCAEQAGQTACLLPRPALQLAGSPKDPGNIQQLPGIQHPAQPGPGQTSAHRADIAKGRSPLHGDHPFCIGGLPQQVGNLSLHVGGPQLQRRLLGSRAHRLLLQHAQNAGELQGEQGFFVQLVHFFHGHISQILIFL